ncbi:MAG: hypothetical protein ACYSWU_26300 [Planctomycetota bacterium]|jgi:hypothetical protein
MSTGITPMPGGPVAAGAGEFGISQKAASAFAEVQAFIFLAKQFPRDEAKAGEAIVAAAVDVAQRDLGPNYEGVEYVYPRGGKTVRGPSIYFAVAAARLWGNIEFGVKILEENSDDVICLAYAWDGQSNTRPNFAFTVKKQIQRKDEHGNTRWVKPDVRELRELVNNIGARSLRNCIIQLLPAGLIDRAVQAARSAAGAAVEADPGAELKKLLAAFQTLKVTNAMLKEFLGHPVTLRKMTADEIVQLRGVWKTIKDGQAKWSDYVKKSAAPAEKVDFDKEFADAPDAGIRQPEEPKPNPDQSTATADGSAAAERLKFGEKPTSDKAEYPD